MGIEKGIVYITYMKGVQGKGSDFGVEPPHTKLGGVTPPPVPPQGLIAGIDSGDRSRWRKVGMTAF